MADLENGDLYEGKTGLVSDVGRASTKTGLTQAETQGALIGQRVDLVNYDTGAVIPDFFVRSVTWISEGPISDVGFTRNAYNNLLRLGIWRRVIIE